VRVDGFQELIRDAYLERDRERGLDGTFLWLVEEVGELSEALRDDGDEDVAEEVADVIAWTVSIANLEDVDVAEALEEKYGEPPE
jgi:NTP pyrophosphatase (non-canonical NTP hydrolase)